MATESDRSIDAAQLQQLAALRAEIHTSIQTLVALGDGGWNHGAKQMRASADAMQHLKYAEASLRELDDAAADGA